MKQRTNRLILLAVVLMCIIQGATYIWTVFQPYIQEEFQMSVAASSQPFTVMLALFSIGGLFGGAFQKKMGLRTTIFLGNLLVCAGFALSAFTTIHSTWLLLLGFGAFVGFGAGYAFNAIIVAAQSWFPDQKGLITGITVGSVGASCAILNPICDYLLSLFGYRTAFFIVAALCVLCTLSVFLLPADPKAHEMHAANKSTTQNAASLSNTLAAAPQDNILTHMNTMLHSSAFLAVTAAMALIVPSYFLLNPLVKSLGMERGLSNSEALTGVIIFSIANIIGRFIIPWSSDYINRKTVVRFLYAASIIAAFGLVIANGFLYIILAALVSLIYGGVMGIFPILVGDSFGTENQGINLGIVMLGTSITAFFCPVILDVFGIEISFGIAGAACFIGLLLTKKI